MSIGERIKKRRLELGISVDDLAEKIGKNRATIYRYESKEIESMPADILMPLADALRISPYELLSDNEQPIEVVKAQLFPIKVFESASAGFGAFTNDDVVGVEYLPFASEAEAHESLCIKVSGDSMSPKIEDGDIVQVRRQSSVDSGDIAVVLVNKEEGFIKKVEYNVGTKPDYINLISLNREYPTMTFVGPEVQRVEVVGKVKRILRDL